MIIQEKSLKAKIDAVGSACENKYCILKRMKSEAAFSEVPKNGDKKRRLLLEFLEYLNIEITFTKDFVSFFSNQDERTRHHLMEGTLEELRIGDYEFTRQEIRSLTNLLVPNYISSLETERKMIQTAITGNLAEMNLSNLALNIDKLYHGELANEITKIEVVEKQHNGKNKLVWGIIPNPFALISPKKTTDNNMKILVEKAGGNTIKLLRFAPILAIVASALLVNVNGAEISTYNTQGTNNQDASASRYQNLFSQMKEKLESSKEYAKANIESVKKGELTFAEFRRTVRMAVNKIKAYTSVIKHHGANSSDIQTLKGIIDEAILFFKELNVAFGEANNSFGYEINELTELQKSLN